MEKQKLHDLLQKLHTELEEGQAVDDDNRELLAEVLADIRRTIDQSHEELAGEHHSLSQRLRDATWQLEESHPTLASTAREFITALGQIFQ